MSGPIPIDNNGLSQDRNSARWPFALKPKGPFTAADLAWAKEMATNWDVGSVSAILLAALLEAEAKVATMQQTVKDFLPRNVCLTNTNVPDSMNLPLDCSLGELRKLAALVDDNTKDARA